MKSVMKMEGRIQTDQFILEMLFSGKPISTCLFLASPFEDASALSFRHPPKKKQRGPLEH